MEAKRRNPDMDSKKAEFMAELERAFERIFKP